MIRGGTSYLIREVGVGQEALLSRPWAPDTPPPEEKGFWKHRPRGGVGRGLVVGAFYVSPPPSRSRGAFTPLHPRLPFHATPSVNLPPCPCGGQQCHLPADGLSLSSGGQLLSRGTSECRFFWISPQIVHPSPILLDDLAGPPDLLSPGTVENGVSSIQNGSSCPPLSSRTLSTAHKQSGQFPPSGDFPGHTALPGWPRDVLGSPGPAAKNSFTIFVSLNIYKNRRMVCCSSWGRKESDMI